MKFEEKKWKDIMKTENLPGCRGRSLESRSGWKGIKVENDNY